jgi:hypothetical protein
MDFSARLEKITEIETGRRLVILAFALIFVNSRSVQNQFCGKRVMIAFSLRFPTSCLSELRHHHRISLPS